MRILAAKYVLPISAEPITNGAVAIDADSVVSIGNRQEVVSQFPTAELTDFGEAAILPGFVNCHSHLEITGMRGSLDDVEHDFTSWLLKLNGIRSGFSEEEILAYAVLGAREGARAGVTCFGDIGRMGQAGLHALKTVGLRGIVFQETEFSADNRTADADFARLIARSENLRREETDLVKVGLSPHSPYTVSSRLFEMLAQYSMLNRVPLSIHAAESAFEHELLTSGTGSFVSVYEKYGVEWSSPYCSPIEYLERLGVLAARPLLAHCVRATDRDLSRIETYGAKIAHCPKSNAKFGHGYAPLEAMLDHGIVVGLGSDSVASNNVCDMLEESRFAALAARNRVPGISPHEERTKTFLTARQMLETATFGGARALGLDDQIGTLESGKQADIAVISLTEPAQRPVSDVHTALVFASNARDVVITLVAGNEVYRKAD